MRAAILTIYAVIAATTAGAQPIPSYRVEPLPKTKKELAARFTPAQIDVLEMLNRRDREHLLRADPPVPGLIVPETWTTDLLTYSPFPRQWPAAQALGKALVVDQPMQAFAAYENGQLVRWGPVSTGRRETPTPDGAFHLTWRARSRSSTDNEDWLLEWYFNFVNERGVSFHLFDLPGYPASHACVRLLLRDAQWLYGWGEQWTLDESHREVVTPGTPVLILGSYPFGTPALWLSLDALARPIALPAELTALRQSACRGVREPTPLLSERAAANEPRERSEPAERRESERVGESEGRCPSDNHDGAGAGGCFRNASGR